ncbi:hypothetical protein GP486_006611 [Trichoglossum hirsutum]|uniref:Uncharacterized protein n=1 Tax=Trichoglossum hirsutum TaxID=265104 RepID=A0A9P8IJ04_9PEZI|nr:hypothetical protein GP486_006611 [Trichoglossum hirsutum]
MRLQTTLTTTILLVAQTLGVSGSVLLSKGLIGSPELVAARSVRSASHLTVRTEEVSAQIERKDGSTPRLQKMDTGAWDKDTAGACMKALAALAGHVSNPSGIAVCYNLPFYDNTTGVFQADLRLYHMLDPKDEWAGVKSQDINVGLSYVGAAVSSAMSKRTVPLRFSISNPPAKRDTDSSLEERQDAPAPQMLQVFNFVGQINKDLITPNLTESSAQTLLTPSIVLTATNPQGQKVSTMLSVDEVHFVNGAFAGSVTAKATSPTTAAAVSTTPSPAFVLPGTTLGIFPIGLIITSAWVAIFISAVGYGTIRRYQFREHYRMRMKRGAGAVKTI